MKQPIAKCFLVIAGLIIGCSSPGVLVSRQVEQNPPKMGKVQVDGWYGLFMAGDDTPLYDLPLKKDDPIGFEWGDDGSWKWIYAVGGASRNRVDLTRTTEWRRLPAQRSSNGVKLDR